MPQAKGKGDGKRIPRVEREIREVISTYLVTGFRGTLPGIVSISRVIASKDLRNAKVLVHAMGVSGDATEAEKKEAVQELTTHVHEIQHEVNRRLQMRHCPRLTFLYDTGYEHAMRVENILRDLSQEREKAAKAAKPESSSED